MVNKSGKIDKEDKTTFLLVDVNKPINLECKLFITKKKQDSTLKDDVLLTLLKIMFQAK